MQNSYLKCYGNIRNRKTTGEWPLKFLVNCQHSHTEHESWQQLPGQEPYAETRLTESHIFSVGRFSHGLSLSVVQQPHMVLNCPDHSNVGGSSCLCHCAFVTPVCVGGWDHPSCSPQLSSLQCPALTSRSLLSVLTVWAELGQAWDN